MKDDLQKKLVDAVRAWAHAECGATEADAILAALSKLDDGTPEEVPAKGAPAKFLRLPTLQEWTEHAGSKRPPETTRRDRLVDYFMRLSQSGSDERLHVARLLADEMTRDDSKPVAADRDLYAELREAIRRNSVDLDGRAPLAQSHEEAILAVGWRRRT